MANASGAFIRRKRGTYATAPGPWQPYLNLPNNMRSAPMGFVRTGYPAFKDRTQTAIAEAEAGGFHPAMLMPRPASNPFTTRSTERRHPIDASKAVLAARTRLAAFRDAALERIGIPSHPRDAQPYIAPAADQSQGVPSFSQAETEEPAIYRTAAAMQKGPIPFFDPKAREVTHPAAFSQQLRAAVLDKMLR